MQRYLAFSLLFLSCALAFAQPPARIDAAEAARLEASLAKAPDNAAARWTLLAYYRSAPNQEAKRRHVLWLIEHTPEDPRLRSPMATLMDAEGKAAAARLWREQASKPDAPAIAISSAAEFFKVSDRSFARQIVDNGLKRFPDSRPLAEAKGTLEAFAITGAKAVNNFGMVSVWDEDAAASPEARRAREELEAEVSPDVLSGAGMALYSQHGMLRAQHPKLAEQAFDLSEQCLRRALLKRPGDETARTTLTGLYVGASYNKKGAERVAPLEKGLAIARTPTDRCFVLANLADAHLQSGQTDAAGREAAEVLKLTSEVSKADWNYGNLIFDANTVAGRVALKKDDVAAAGEHLIAAGKTPGSPQLNSFGPKWTLARELLDRGERDAVLQFLESCKGFWKGKSERLDDFAATIRAGATPDFEHPELKIVNMTGQEAPAFQAPQLDGVKVDLSTYKGKVVLLDFWATWCAPCRAEMPTFEILHREFADKDVAIVGVDVDEDADTVGAFIKKQKYSFPVLLSIETEATKLYHVSAYPTLVVIDKTGKIADYVVGSRNEEQLREIIAKVRK